MSLYSATALAEFLKLMFSKLTFNFYTTLFWMTFLLHIDIKLWGRGGGAGGDWPWSWKRKHTDDNHKILPWKKKFKFFNYPYEIEHLYLCLCTVRLSNNIENVKVYITLRKNSFNYLNFNSCHMDQGQYLCWRAIWKQLFSGNSKPERALIKSPQRHTAYKIYHLFKSLGF